ncbi:MAG: methyltransferase domain-containing protein [Thermoleophilaceae bacterium]
MESRTAATRFMAEAAALARIEEVRSMATQDFKRNAKAGVRAMWALGDYHAFATALVWTVGPELVSACGIGSGQGVLDVAAGTGNVAIRAAEAGADVVASDLTPENFEAGRREAAARGVQLDWVEADAEALPFSDGAFDVVTSSFGAIFAPEHKAVAGELLRVCRPGGTIGMANFTPEGLAGTFFELLGRYAPPPPPGPPPLLWGTESHVRELLGDGLDSLELERREYVERPPDPEAYCELFKRTFGPMIATREGLRDDPERLAALDSELLEFARRSNRGAPEGPAEYPYEFLLVVARKRAA